VSEIKLPEEWGKGSWLVIYHTGEVMSSRDYEIWDLPKTGVMAVIMWNQQAGCRLFCEVDYYVWKTGIEYSRQGGEWYPATQDAFYKYLFNTPKPCVLFGEYVDDDWYNAIRIVAEKYRTAIHRLESDSE